MFTRHLLLDHVQFTLVHGPNIPCSYAILFFTALAFHHQTHPQLGMLSTLAHLFILSVAISPFSPVAYWTPTDLGGHLSVSYHFAFSPFHTVHGVLEARILKWFVIPFSSGPRFVRTLHCDLCIFPKCHVVGII